MWTGEGEGERGGRGLRGDRVETDLRAYVPRSDQSVRKQFTRRVGPPVDGLQDVCLTSTPHAGERQTDRQTDGQVLAPPQSVSHRTLLQAPQRTPRRVFLCAKLATCMPAEKDNVIIPEYRRRLAWRAGSRSSGWASSRTELQSVTAGAPPRSRGFLSSFSSVE